MLDRIAEAFTKPRLQQTPIDELIVGVICIVAMVVAGVVGFLVWRWMTRGEPTHPVLRQAERQTKAMTVPGPWHYGDKTTISPAPPPKRA
jgi:hypothetical protein